MTVLRDPLLPHQIVLTRRGFVGCNCLHPSRYAYVPWAGDYWSAYDALPHRP